MLENGLKVTRSDISCQPTFGHPRREQLRLLRAVDSQLFADGQRILGLKSLVCLKDASLTLKFGKVSLVVY